jgi:hypothetical protein
MDEQQRCDVETFGPMTPRANIIWWVLFIGLTVALAIVVRSETVNLSWPATGGTNRVMLDGVQQAYTPGTNAIIQVTNDNWPVGVQIIGGGKCYTTRFSIEQVARWTGGQEFATNIKGPWSPVTLRPGSKLPSNGSGYFRAVLTKQTEIVPWWQWGGQEGREP